MRNKKRHSKIPIHAIGVAANKTSSSPDIMSFPKALKKLVEDEAYILNLGYAFSFRGDKVLMRETPADFKPILFGSIINYAKALEMFSDSPDDQEKLRRHFVDTGISSCLYNATSKICSPISKLDMTKSVILPERLAYFASWKPTQAELDNPIFVDRSYNLLAQDGSLISKVDDFFEAVQGLKDKRDAFAIAFHKVKYYADGTFLGFSNPHQKAFRKGFKPITGLFDLMVNDNILDMWLDFDWVEDLSHEKKQ